MVVIAVDVNLPSSNRVHWNDKHQVIKKCVTLQLFQGLVMRLISRNTTVR